MDIFIVALLATVIIWLQDINNEGILNMTPSAREALIKKNESSSLIQGSSSINDDATQSVDEFDENSAPQFRNKFLKRIGVDGGNSSDCEPLLQ